MSTPFTDYAGKNTAQATTAKSYNPKNNHKRVQITVQPSASSPATSGTVAIKYKSAGGLNAEELKDAYGAAVVITLAAQTSVTRVFDLVADEIQGVPNSANGNYDMIVTWIP